ncbi:hypothetical protein ACFQZU_23135, partial [Streptomonospora algeriensis]
DLFELVDKERIETILNQDPVSRPQQDRAMAPASATEPTALPALHGQVNTVRPRSHRPGKG